jgi:predicted enzyme related to lactoylglutathione lyase
MPPVLQSMVAATYVRDMDAARAFYEALGFREEFTGKAERSAWSTLHHGSHTVLLASTQPPLEVPRLPLLFYFFFDDLESVLAALTEAGVAVERLGHAPHALGGEAKVIDPEGNTVLLGQRERSASQGLSDDEVPSRFSLLREAAAVVAARGEPVSGCEVSEPSGEPCSRTAEVRLADSAGVATWACIPHAEEILVTVSGAFVASDSDRGIAAFLAGRRV